MSFLKETFHPAADRAAILGGNTARLLVRG
jgi:hypothetical protein